MSSRFEIDWILDEEDEPLDAASLVGRFIISDGVRSIDERSVYVDSWFVSLIRAVKSATREVKEIEILEHPERLIVWCDQEGRLHLAFRNHEVTAVSLEKFTRVLKRRAGDFLKQADSIPGKPDPSQREIRAFLESS